MPIFTVREYDKLATDANGIPIPVGLEPAVATQVKTTGVSSGSLSAFNNKTRYILIGVDTARVNWIIAASPTAVVGGAGRLAADEHMFFGVESGGRDDAGLRTPLTIAVIDDA